MKLTLALAGLALSGFALAQKAPAPTDFIGKTMPKFEMTALDGTKVNNETLKGKAYILDFWATWCGPCKKAAPTMQELHAKYNESGLVVIGANTFERAEGPDNAKKYKAEHGYGYLFTYGNDDFAKSLNIQGIPTFFFVDKDGMVSDVIVGFTDQWKQKFMDAANKAMSN
ncbi:MAG: TlpA family protein disulfide reductase [Fimbriimonadaceae bacterium]